VSGGPPRRAGGAPLYAPPQKTPPRPLHDILPPRGVTGPRGREVTVTSAEVREAQSRRGALGGVKAPPTAAVSQAGKAEGIGETFMRAPKRSCDSLKSSHAEIAILRNNGFFPLQHRRNSIPGVPK
jgi:hypothetical protein